MIEVRSVTFAYDIEGDPAVKDVSLQISPGESVGIVGPNGSGKSTLARLIKGLVLPSAGRVVVDGVDTAADGIHVRRLVGLVFQNPDSQIVNSVVEQEVAFGPENLGLPPADIRRRVDEALFAVGLRGKETAECHSLSMADKQRIAIAAVIAMGPRYLVLDEPTAWIEPRARSRLLAEVRGWADAHGAGLVLVTHRMDEAQLCDRLYGILRGHLEVEGAPADVLQDVKMRARLALAVPQALLLTSELRAAGLPVVPGQSADDMAEALCRS